MGQVYLHGSLQRRHFFSLGIFPTIDLLLLGQRDVPIAIHKEGGACWSPVPRCASVCLCVRACARAVSQHFSRNFVTAMSRHSNVNENHGPHYSRI
jgi:hypothetical protein